jgi:hypothetical protein
MNIQLMLKQLLQSLPDPWVEAMNPPLKKLLQLQRVTSYNLMVGDYDFSNCFRIFALLSFESPNN